MTDAPKLEVVEVPDDRLHKSTDGQQQGALVLMLGGKRICAIRASWIPAIRAHLLAGAVEVLIANDDGWVAFAEYIRPAEIGLEDRERRYVLVPQPDTGRSES